VVDDDGVVRGFVAATPDTRAFYREFIVHDGVPAGIAALPRIARAPRFVFETLRYGVRDEGALPKAEILAVAVASELRGNGWGTRLVTDAIEQLAQHGSASARVLTALDNDAALHMYEHAGFRRQGVASVHRGVDQAVLVWP
jgi:GNAT superfamily N-acetyltransferase